MNRLLVWWRSCQNQPFSTWHDLQEDLLLNIFGRLHTLPDFLAVRGVCRRWRQLAPFCLASQNPLLLVNCSSYNSYSFFLFDIVAQRRHSLPLPRSVFKAIAYSHGNIVLCCNRSIVLCDIFTGVNICLPDPPDISFRALLSARPDSQNCRVLLFGSTIQCLNVGSTRWIVVPFPDFRCVSDVMHFNGDFLVLYIRGKGFEVFLGELTGDSLNVRKLGNSGVLVKDFNRFWLAELHGAVLVVALTEGMDILGIWRGEFSVFRLNPESNEWEEIDDLGGKGLFVSTSGGATLVEVAGFGWTENCVYFATNLDRAWTMFNLKDKSFQMMSFGNFYPHLWVFPSYC